MTSVSLYLEKAATRLKVLELLLREAYSDVVREARVVELALKGVLRVHRRRFTTSALSFWSTATGCRAQFSRTPSVSRKRLAGCERNARFYGEVDLIPTRRSRPRVGRRPLRRGPRARRLCLGARSRRSIPAMPAAGMSRRERGRGRPASQVTSYGAAFGAEVVMQRVGRLWRPARLPASASDRQSARSWLTRLSRAVTAFEERSRSSTSGDRGAFELAIGDCSPPGICSHDGLARRAAG